jgi:hypothetical protein
MYSRRFMAPHATAFIVLQSTMQLSCFSPALQDGVEEYNTIDGNLAAFVHVIGKVLHSSRCGCAPS